MAAIETTSRFLSSLGVDVHLEYTDGKYADVNQVVADLSYLGVNQVRDAVLSPSNQGQGAYDVAASAGVKFDFFYQAVPLASTMSLVNAFVARHPGAVDLIEGPNEVNNFPVAYGGLSGDAAAVAYQAALFHAVHGDPSLAGVPVANLTSYPDLAGAADEANFHSYPKNGAPPDATLLGDAARQAAAEPGVPIVMTEGGYTTLLAPNAFGGVDQATQAKYSLDIFLDNAKNGVSQSYLYELLDAYADPTNSDPNRHFGLFNLDGSPKLAATAIHDLTAILSSGASSTVAASPLAFEASLPATGSVLSLTKAAGVHDVLVWNEPGSWNGTTLQEVAAPAVAASLHFDDASDVTVYDPLAGTAPQATYRDVHDVAFGLSDHPLVFEVSTASAGPITQAAQAPDPASPVLGGPGPDRLVAGDGGGVILGLDGDDSLQGGAGRDQLFGNQGADTLAGAGGDDQLFGGQGNDLVSGDGGDDQVFGNLGADTLHGGDGGDTLYGGQGNDLVFGDDGDDVIFGDLGDDTLTGGAGADTFAFAPRSGHDVITDFTKGQDRIDVSAHLAAGETFTLADDATGARITFSTGDTIEVLNVHANALAVSGGWIV